MIRNGVYSLIVGMILVACSSCGGGPDNSKLKIFKYNQVSCRSIDPADAGSQGVIWVVNQVFNGLVQMDEKMNIKPCIAKYWELDPSGTKYTFYLKTNVHFHDHDAFDGGTGRAVVAEDFVYSFNRIMAPETSSDGAWVFNGKVRKENPFVALNDSVFEVHLEKSFPPFLGMLSMQYCSVVPKEVVSKLGKQFAKNPIGTGPFRFKKWDEGKNMYLVKNKDYFEKFGSDQLPYLDAIKISFINDKHTELMSFLKGDLDFLTSIDASIKDELLTSSGELKENHQDKIDLNKLPYLNTEYLGFMVDPTIEKDVDGKSLKNHPIFNVKVRQAIAHAIDKDDIVRYLRNNIGQTADYGFIPKVMYGDRPYSWNGFDFDPNRSRQLLSEAGYPNGEGIPEISLYVEKGAQDICNSIQAQLRNIGIKIKLVSTNKSFIKTERDKSSLICFYGQWIMDYPDPETFLTCFYGKNPSSPNFTRFQNEEFDALYEKAMNTVDEEERMAIYMKLDSIGANQVPLIPIYYDEIVNFSHKHILNLNVTPSKLLNLKYVDIFKEEENQ